MFKEKLTGKYLLSDHMPFIAKTQHETLTLIGWNVLCQMKFNDKWKYFNNGFNCPKESDEQYNNRLKHLVAQIAYAAKKEKPAFFCMQECPELTSSLTEFETGIKQNELLKHYGMVYFKNDNGYCLITLYDTSAYILNGELTEKIKHLPLKEGLATRILPLVFTNNKSKEIMLVVNVHANFNMEIQQDVKTLYEFANNLGIKNIALIGDYNRDLTKSVDNSKHDIATALDSNGRFADALYVNCPRDSSFCSKYNQTTNDASQGLETRDGIMSTFPVNVVCMPEINVPNLELLFSMQISPHLSTIPNEFLELAPKSKVETNLSL